LNGVNYWQVRFSAYTPAIASVAEQRALMKEVGAGIPFRGTGEAGGASSEPPLYYALETIPYAMGAGNVLVQLQLMRLFGALLGGITALLTFLFLRETLPRVPWAATVGAVCVALQPQFAFTSGSVNPDALLYALSAAVFLCLARGFHRRFTRRLAIVLGLLIAAGFTTYFSFIGVAVGAFAALAVLAVREARSRRREALLSLAIAVGIGLAPPVLYALRNALLNRHTFGQASGVGGAITIKSLFHELSYIWQLYLPRLPGMTHYFAGITTWRDIWFDRSVGLYGWMDTMFPVWVDSVALVLAAAVALLCGRELFMRRHVLRSRLP
jgi:4-amino-4-deoxy-L-arabinose transferase-like glycosyltransferase